MTLNLETNKSYLLKEQEKCDRRAHERLEALDQFLDDTKLREEAKHRVDCMKHPDHKPAFKIYNQEVDEADAVVKLFLAKQRAAEARTEAEDTLSKLIERINLDRPIM